MLFMVGFVCGLIALWAERHLVDIYVNRKGFAHSPITIPFLVLRTQFLDYQP